MSSPCRSNPLWRRVSARRYRFDASRDVDTESCLHRTGGSERCRCGGETVLQETRPSTFAARCGRWPAGLRMPRPSRLSSSGGNRGPGHFRWRGRRRHVHWPLSVWCRPVPVPGTGPVLGGVPLSRLPASIGQWRRPGAGRRASRIRLLGAGQAVAYARRQRTDGGSQLVRRMRQQAVRHAGVRARDGHDLHRQPGRPGAFVPTDSLFTRDRPSWATFRGALGEHATLPQGESR